MTLQELQDEYTRLLDEAAKKAMELYELDKKADLILKQIEEQTK